MITGSGRATAVSAAPGPRTSIATLTAPAGRPVTGQPGTRLRGVHSVKPASRASSTERNQNSARVRG